MAVNVEMWKKEVIQKLYADNAFLSRAINADEYVVGGRVVHIPQSGGPSGFQKNPTVYPLPVVVRGDTDVLYSLDQYSSNPTLITDIDKKELSYDKRQSVIEENTGELMEAAGSNMLFKWADAIPAASRINTSGANRAATAIGATGNRKTITIGDIIAAKALLDKQNIPKNGRILVLPSDWANDLMSATEARNYFQNVIDLKTGELPQFYGFEIYQRSYVARVDSGDTLKLPEAAGATTDNDVAAFYQVGAVERALGDVGLFDNPQRAEYQADMLSFLLRLGGRRRRADNRGFGLIVGKA